MSKYKLNLFCFLSIFLNIFLIIIIFIKPNIATTIKDKIFTKNEISEYYVKTNSYYKRMAGNLENDTNIFIGDSITQGLNVSAVKQNSVNFGIGGDTTKGVINRITDYKVKETQDIYLLIGINDLQFRGNEEIINNYNTIFSKLNKNNIYLTSIMPLDKDYQDRNNKFSNERIASLNKDLKDICNKNSKCKYIDIYQKLLDTNGYLDQKYHIGDGIHLNTSGYNLWISEIKKKNI